MNIISASSPSFTSSGGINLRVTFDTIGEVEFHATPNDMESHGVELYNRALAGEFGPVQDYQPPAHV